MCHEYDACWIRSHNFLKDYGAHNILFPLNVSVYVSMDKENWGTVAHLPTLEILQTGSPWEQVYEWDGSKARLPNEPSATVAYARYVKVSSYYPYLSGTLNWLFIVHTIYPVTALIW